MTTEKLTHADFILDLTTLPIATGPGLKPEIEGLLNQLAPDTPWGERRLAAQRLGNLRDRRAVPALVNALPGDTFWMVRCAMIQALEKIGDPLAVPTLQDVEKNDAFQVVRAYAGKAVERILGK
jgi:HEAT repeat protein